MICFAVIKGFIQPKCTRDEIKVRTNEKMLLPDANLLAEKNLLGDMNSIMALKKSTILGVFTGQAVSTISLTFLFFCVST